MTTLLNPNTTKAPWQKGNRKKSGARSNAVHIRKTINITATPEKLYQEWRNFSNLPRFMDHLKEVSVIDASKSHWIVKAPIGFRVEWDAKIIEDIPNQRIAWKSLEDADVDNEGSVTFNAIGQNATIVHVDLFYNPPVGEIGRMLAKLFGEEPEQQIEEDLERFKFLMEVSDVEYEH